MLHKFCLNLVEKIVVEIKKLELTAGGMLLSGNFIVKMEIFGGI